MLAVVLFIGIAIVFAAVQYLSNSATGGKPLVVYCAHDAVYSDEVLDRFEAETGITVSVVHDTEATKALAHVERLIREQDNPQCDVFWNNELLGTLDLQRRGILEPYVGTNHARIPDALKADDGTWAGFGSRLRVWIINTDNLDPTPDAVAAYLEREDLSRLAIAKPLYGTTLTHYSVLFDALGPDGAKALHADMLARAMKVVDGNGRVKDLVADGVCDLGLTDTDDFFLAVDAGKPVASLPFALQDGQTICIPNTVSIIKGTSNRAAAEKLVDFLLSQENEQNLANSRSRQIPVGPIADGSLPEEVAMIAPWVADGYPLGGLLDARDACIAWLKGDSVETLSPDVNDEVSATPPTDTTAEPAE